MEIKQFRIRCKVKEGIEKLSGKIVVKPGILEYGDDGKILLDLDFKEDIKVEIDLECSAPAGFECQEAVKASIERQGTIPIDIKLVDADPGRYYIWGTVEDENAEIELESTTLDVREPDLKILECSADEKIVGAGATVKIKGRLEYKSPGRIKGTLSGRVYCNDDVQRKCYELQAKKFSFQGEKEVQWEIRIPRTEFGKGVYDAELRFVSKDRVWEERFEDVLQLKKGYDLSIAVSSSENFASEGENVKIFVDAVNEGLKPVNAEFDLKLSVGEKEIGESFQGRLMLEAGERKRLEFDWTVHEMHGKVLGDLHWRMLESGEEGHLENEILKIKKAHEFSILNAIASKGFVNVGGSVAITAYVVDSGAKAGAESELRLLLRDSSGNAFFEGARNANISNVESEVVWNVNVPEGIEGNVNAELIMNYDGERVAEKRFARIFSVSKPVKIRVHTAISESRIEPELGDYLLEWERIEFTDEHSDLKIHALNSGVYIYELRNEVVDGCNWDSENNKEFAGLLFSSIALKTRFTTRYIESSLALWNKLGYYWVSRAVKLDSELGKVLASSKVEPDNWGKVIDNVDLLYSIMKDSGHLDLSLEISKAFDYLRKKEADVPKRFKQLIDNVMRACDENDECKLELESFRPLFQKKIVKEKDDARCKQSQFAHALLLSSIAKELKSHLEWVKDKREIKADTASRIILYQILYLLAHSEHCRSEMRYNPYSKDELSEGMVESNLRAIEEIAFHASFLFNTWKMRVWASKENMKQRRGIALLRRNLEIKIIPGSSDGQFKAVLRNKHHLPLKMNLKVALPSDEWGVLEPETQLIGDVYYIKNLEIEGNGKREMDFSVSFPSSLSLSKYYIIMKAEPCIDVLSEFYGGG